MVAIAAARRTRKDESRPPSRWNPYVVDDPEGVHLKWVRWLIGAVECEAAGKPPRAVNQIEMALRLRKHPSSMARWEQGRDPVPLEIYQAALFQLLRARGLAKP